MDAMADNPNLGAAKKVLIEKTCMFLASHTTVRSLKRALDDYVAQFPSEELANVLLVTGLTTSVSANCTVTKGRRLSKLDIVAVLVDRFGTSKTAWPEYLVTTFLCFLGKSRINTTVCVYLFLTLDSDCFTLTTVTSLLTYKVGKVTRKSYPFAINSHLAKYLPPDAPDHFDFPADLLERMPSDAYTEITTYASFFGLFRDYPESYMARIVRIFVDKISESLLVHQVENGALTGPATILENLWFLHSSAIHLVPESMHGQVPIAHSTIKLLCSQTDWDGGSLDTEGAKKFAALATTDTLREVHEGLLEDLAADRRDIAPLEEQWQDLYPGQTVENHTCPLPWDGHVCEFDQSPDTCRECCMNCVYDHHCLRYKLRERLHYYAVTEELLTYFCVPTTAKACIC